MKENQPEPHPRSKTRRAANAPLYVIGVVVLLLVALFYLYLQKGTIAESARHQAESSDGGSVHPSPAPGNILSQEHSPANQQPATGQRASDTTLTATISDENSSGLDGPKLQESEEPAQGDRTVRDGDDPAQSKEIKILLETLNDFYSHLDQQPYMAAFALSEPSRNHFSQLLTNLLANPPVIARETDDLYTLLRNTAHFFRVLGKNNMLLLKGILDQERESLEMLLKTFYALTFHPEALEKEFGLIIPPEALYDYGAFFLHTIGGRLYLFRRDSTSRMVISYYAILIVDRANSSGEGRHGIDLLPPVDALIEEIENGGRRLKFREEYLDTLYDLKEKYLNRSG